MNSMTHQVSDELCTGCAACVAVCPARIFELSTPKARPVPELTAFCISCGHCMAVCPQRAVTVPGLEYDTELFDLPANPVDAGMLEEFLASRRSVRSYRSEPVSRAQLEKIVEVIAMAPMGFPPQKVKLTIVDDPAQIEELLPHLTAAYAQLQRLARSPFGRLILRRELGSRKYRMLQEHLMPSMTHRLAGAREHGVDTFTRGAPAMILFHTDRDALVADSDPPIALTYGLLAAHSLGLGAAAIDLVAPVLNRMPAARRVAGLPDDQHVWATMILGHPKQRYYRGVRRKLASVTWAKTI